MVQSIRPYPADVNVVLKIKSLLLYVTKQKLWYFVGMLSEQIFCKSVKPNILQTN